ncbi:tetratricopeptide repeat protein [Streptomyces sp. NPDC004830]
MSGIQDIDDLRRALADNAGQPEGPARNTRARELVTAAEGLAGPRAVIEALGHQVRVCHHSGERGGAFAPFSRLLRMWDERPGDFEAHEARSLHGMFAWVCVGLLDQPDVPLASVEECLGDMERRYRLAGYSERAVRSTEHRVAAHVGDLERAGRAYTAWLAADRDGTADCPACDLHGQGRWQAERGRDAQALRLWRPVLEGAHACAREPDRVLASSLLPLLRLGRADEAGAGHLRGFRLVRGRESMRGAHAEHVEFCALTGNEARGLELLAERPAYFTDDGNPRSRLEFLSAVTLLMDRLVVRGLGGLGVPGPAGREWTAEVLAAHARAEALALAARFDARNGTAYVGERARARMAQEPLVERLPLGVRAARPLPAPAPPPAPAPAASPPDLPALLAEARRLSETLRPGAVEAWAAAARAAEAVGAELAARDRAEIAEHAATDLGAAGVELFEQAAESYAAAGDPGEALAARARAAYVRALAGEVAAATARVAGPYEEVLALYAAGGTGLRQTASVLMSRARVLMRAAHAAAGPGAAATLADAEAAVREVPALVGERGGEDVRLAARVAEARAMLGELARLAGDLRTSAELFAQGAAAFVAAGLPWFAVEYEARLATLAHELGDARETERALRAALEHGGDQLEPPGRARLHLQLAEVTGGRGDAVEAAAHALRAAHWADEAGESASLGAWARQQLGGLLLAQGRWAEAAEVLECALPDLNAETHGDEVVVQTLWWLGDCLGELGEHRAAAERRLQAAGIARAWPEQHDHATLTHLAGESFGQAGLTAEADRAYTRAGGLWRALGDTPGVVRALRARAWLVVDAGEDPSRARELMTSAVRECERARDAAADEETRRRLTAELGDTHRQFGDLLAAAADEEPEGGAARPALEEAHAHLMRSVGVFVSLGPAALHDRTDAELAAGRLEAGLARTAEARARARGVLAAYDGYDAYGGCGDGDGLDGSESERETVAARRTEAEQLRRLLTDRPD